MAKEKDRQEKITLLGSDDVTSNEEVIEADKNVDRQKAFKEAYKRVMQIIPGYFLEQKKKKKAGGGFQNIIVTPKEVKIETKYIKENVAQREDMERERED